MKSAIFFLLFASFIFSCDLERIENDISCDKPVNSKIEFSFGGGILDSATAVVKTMQNEYFITGFTKKQGSKILLYKTNLCKDTLLYLAEGDNSLVQKGSAVCETSAGEIVIAGTQVEFGVNKGYLIRVNDKNVIMDSWKGFISSGLKLNDIKSRPGDFILGGSITTDAVSKKQNACVIIVDAALNIIKSVSFSTSFESGIYEVVSLPNRIVGVGNVWNGFGERIMFVTTDANGNSPVQRLLSFRNIGGDNNVAANCAVATQDGKMAVAGNYKLLLQENRFAFLIKMDAEGNTIWERDYADASSAIIGDHVPSRIIQTSDGGYLIVGTHKLNTSNSDIFLLKTDANGAYLWSRSYGGAMNDVANDVLQETDGGYVVVGYTSSFNTAGETGRIYFLKTDGEGRIY